MRSSGWSGCEWHVLAHAISDVRLAKKHYEAGKLSKADYKRIRRKNPRDPQGGLISHVERIQRDPRHVADRDP